jgi:hypothetical protein
MGKTFPSEMLQDLHCGTAMWGVGLVVVKDNFLCEQARMFPLDGFLQVSQFVFTTAAWSRISSRGMLFATYLAISTAVCA